MQLNNASALVTGGASGLGAATARRLHAEGAAVIIADMNEDKGKDLAQALGSRAQFVKTDVTQPAEVQAAIDAAQALAPLRVAVNCAGIAIAKRTLNRENEPHELEDFTKVITVNVIGTFNVLRLAASAMAKNDAVDGERGVIVNTASVAAFEGQIGQIAYGTSKAAVHGMTIPAARDLSSVGIRVNTIAPGIFDTPMLAGLPEKARESLAQSVVFPKALGQPSWYAHLVHFFVTNPYVNGETVRLDGAIRMGPK